MTHWSYDSLLRRLNRPTTRWSYEPSVLHFTGSTHRWYFALRPQAMWSTGPSTDWSYARLIRRPMDLLPDTQNCWLRMCLEYRKRFPRHRLLRKPLVSDHGTCVTHVPWCKSGSQTRGGGENVPGIPGTCATRNFTYLARVRLDLQIGVHGSSTDPMIHWFPEPILPDDSAVQQIRVKI